MKRTPHSALTDILSCRMIKRATGEVVCTGRSTHCFADNDGRPMILKRYYPEWDEKLKSVFTEGQNA